MDKRSKTMPDCNSQNELSMDPAHVFESGSALADDFSFDGYQVVRGEFFAHSSEPSITICNAKIYVNMACINKLPNVDYVQILINPEEKKLVVRPCREDEKDSFLWCNTNKGKRKPKRISGRVFFAKIIHLMDWNPDYRYKMIGKLIRSNDEQLFVFDLTAHEMFQQATTRSGKPNSPRIPSFPAEWQNQFGLPLEEHRKSLQVNIFNGYVVFGIKDTSAKHSDADPERPDGTYEESDSFSRTDQLLIKDAQRF